MGKCKRFLRWFKKKFFKRKTRQANKTKKARKDRKKSPTLPSAPVVSTENNSITDFDLLYLCSHSRSQVLFKTMALVSTILLCDSMWIKAIIIWCRRWKAPGTWQFTSLGAPRQPSYKHHATYYWGRGFCCWYNVLPFTLKQGSQNFRE